MQSIFQRIEAIIPEFRASPAQILADGRNNHRTESCSDVSRGVTHDSSDFVRTQSSTYALEARP